VVPGYRLDKLRTKLGVYAAGMLSLHPTVSYIFWQKSGEVTVGSQALMQNVLLPMNLAGNAVS
jgi:uncharacterized membrane protein